MKKCAAVGVVALLLAPTTKSMRLTQAIRDWDDLLSNQSVFNDASYASDTPDGYSDAVNEFIQESEKENNNKRKNAFEAAKLQQKIDE